MNEDTSKFIALYIINIMPLTLKILKLHHIGSALKYHDRNKEIFDLYYYVFCCSMLITFI